MIFAIRGPEITTAVSAAQRLADRLAEERDLAWVRAGAGPDLEAAIRDLYFPHRFHFLTDTTSTEELTVSLSEAGLRQAARRLHAQLALPMGTFVRSIATSDPLLACPAQLDRLQEARLGRLKLREGQFVTEDEGHAIVFAATVASPFSSSDQGRVQARLAHHWSAVQRAFPNQSLTLEQGGVHRLSVASERSIRADVSRVSILSTIAIIAMYLILFRSIRQVVLAFVPVLIGCTPHEPSH